MTDNFIVRDLGKAKPGSGMHKRGYVINLAPNAVNKPPGGNQATCQSGAQEEPRGSSCFPGLFKARQFPPLQHYFCTTFVQRMGHAPRDLKKGFTPRIDAKGGALIIGKTPRGNLR